MSRCLSKPYLNLFKILNDVMQTCRQLCWEELDLKPEYAKKNCNVALEDGSTCINGNSGLEKSNQESLLTAFDVICFNSVVIKPHVTRTCGKQRLYGRIQVTVDKSFVGEVVDFKVLVRRVKGDKIV
jgi:hypothetical protein